MCQGYPNWFRNGQEKGEQTNKTDIFVFIQVEIDIYPHIVSSDKESITTDIPANYSSARSAIVHEAARSAIVQEATLSPHPDSSPTADTLSVPECDKDNKIDLQNLVLDILPLRKGIVWKKGEFLEAMDKTLQW